MEFHKTYDSGLKLIIKKMDGLFSVSTGILVGVGSRNESKEENGISHFIEHVNFKGTKTRTAFEISDHIDRIGSSINAYTSKEATVYYTKSTYEHQEETFEILADIFLNSTYLDAELEKEKGVIIEEINMTEDTP
ncbi:MAG: insulinase family protein, partial [Clostridia bacterium]|nr:insulinase family protein [Clostridia bacterium]